jgi:hypothetical protein
MPGHHHQFSRTPHDSESAAVPGCTRYKSAYPAGSSKLSDTLKKMRSNHTRQTCSVARPTGSTRRTKILSAPTPSLLKYQNRNLIREIDFVQHSFYGGSAPQNS